jgi:hypothetical protein
VILLDELSQAEDTLATARSYDSLDDVRTTLPVLLLYGIMWLLGLIGVTVCWCKRRQREAQKQVESSLRKHGIGPLKKFSTHDAQEFLLKYINALCPAVFHMGGSWDRIAKEMTRHHRYLIPFFQRGEDSENIRMLTTLNILTVQSMLMFVLALLYDFEVYFFFKYNSNLLF